MDSTWQPLWAEIAKSFGILAQGGDRAGATVRRGVIWVICGDLEFYTSEFQFPTAMSNFPCMYCCATNNFGENDAPFTDFR